MRFASAYFLVLLLLPPAVEWLRRRRDHRGDIAFPALALFDGLSPSPRAKLAGLPRWLLYAAFVLCVLALARPQAGTRTDEVSDQGIDIMLLMDTSTSMRAIDFKPENRYAAARKVAREFVARRAHDRVGIVVFAGLAYTQCPLTADRDAVLNFLDQTEIGMTTVDGTAIGSAIATGTNRLKDGTGRSRIMVLITDGRSNAGEIDPLTAAQAAAALGIRVYTIGAGQPGGALYPVDDPVWGRQYVKVPEQELDEDTLAKVAEATGGRYFRATDSASLARIMEQINTLEKSAYRTTRYTSYNELFPWFLWPGTGLLLLGLGLRLTWLRRLP